MDGVKSRSSIALALACSFIIALCPKYPSIVIVIAFSTITLRLSLPLCVSLSQLLFVHTLQLRSILNSPNLQLLSVLLQHAIIVVFPELLAGVLAGDALEDLGSAWVLVLEFYVSCQNETL